MALLKLIWTKLSLKDKLFLGVVCLLLLYITYLTINIAYQKHLLLNKLVSDVEAVTAQQAENNKKTAATITKGKTTNTQAIIKKKTIDKQLHHDKKTIDTSTYTDAKLDSLLSSYGN